MSKFGWISGYAEHCLNMAVQERVARWTVKRGLVKDCHRLETDAEMELRRRAHKYKASHWLRAAYHAFKHQDLTRMEEGMRPHSLFGRKRMVRRAQDFKAFQKEVQRRYEVVDRTYGAIVVRKDGRIDRVSKDSLDVRRSKFRREEA
jgi:hypothetical protein